MKNMKSGMRVASAVTTLVILASATTASAAMVYSEDFDGGGETPGQSVTAAPFNWTVVVPPGSRTGMYANLNSGNFGFTGNYLDGETANNTGLNDGYSRLGTDFTVDAGATSLDFEFNMYANSPGGDPIFGSNISIGDKTNLPSRIGWIVNSGQINFTADNGATTWGAFGSIYHNTMLILKIHADFVADKISAEISKDGGATFTSSPLFQLDLPANQFNYVGMTWDRRGSDRSFMTDNLLVYTDGVVPEPATMGLFGIGCLMMVARRRR